MLLRVVQYLLLLMCGAMLTSDQTAPVAALVVAVMGGVAMWVTPASAYALFKQRFYSELYEKTGQRSDALFTESIPDLPFLFYVLVAPFVLVLASGRAPTGPGLVALVVVVVLLVVGTLVQLTPRLAAAMAPQLTGFLVGIYFSLYSLIPFVAHGLILANTPTDLVLLCLAGGSALGIWVIAHVSTVIAEVLLCSSDLDRAQVSTGRTGATQRVSTMSLVVPWCLLATMNIVAIYVALAAVAFGLGIGSPWFVPAVVPTLSSASQYLRVALLLWSCPVLAIASVLAGKWAKGVVESMKRRSDPPGELVQIVAQVSSFADLRLPTVLVDDRPALTCQAVPHVLLRGVLRISRITLQRLTPEELEALIAHEVGHLKKHSIKIGALNVASSWTLFGKWFLSTTLDTRALEFEADDFCVWYLNERRTGVAPLIAALLKVKVHNDVTLFRDQSSAAGTSMARGRRSGERLAEPWSRLKTAYRVFVGDLVVSYLHPTIDERIKRLRAL